MEKQNREIERILTERFGADHIFALATMEGPTPHVRYINAFYENGAFYTITYALSNKMRQIEKNPLIAIAGEWFTGHGIGQNLGYFGSAANAVLAAKARAVFAAWIDNGHNDWEDPNTCILRIQMTDGLLLSHGNRYEIDFRELSDSSSQ